MIKYYNEKTDGRKNYILVLDVETANGYRETVVRNEEFFSTLMHKESCAPDMPLVYDLGGQVVDTKGNVMSEFSFVIEEVFNNQELMNSCYYSDKVPRYKKDLENGTRTMVSWAKAKELIFKMISFYNVKEVSAYNMSFDRNALDWTNHQLTGKKFYFPYHMNTTLKFSCIWFLATQTIFLEKRFPEWAIKNGKYSKSGNFRTNAEVAYAYLHDNPNFEEDHTGLEDVKIEVEIMMACRKKRKKLAVYKINRSCWRLPQAVHQKKRVQYGLKKLTQREMNNMTSKQLKKYNEKRAELGLEAMIAK